MEIEKEIEKIKVRQGEILGFLSKICKILAFEPEQAIARKMLQLKKEIDEALSK
ncbi:hypothetical protein KJA16_02855 [Patescibacteria group bacterium]|nr:hypothetical protein [Patescibacteria group bacterium]